MDVLMLMQTDAQMYITMLVLRHKKLTKKKKVLNKKALNTKCNLFKNIFL